MGFLVSGSISGGGACASGLSLVLVCWAFLRCRREFVLVTGDEAVRVGGELLFLFPWTAIFSARVGIVSCVK